MGYQRLSLPSKPNWIELTPRQTFVAAVTAIQQQEGLAFTLRFHEEDAKRLACSSKTVRAIGKRFTRAFSDFGVKGSHLVFRVEICDDGQLHIHGAFKPVNEMHPDEMKAMFRQVSQDIHGFVFWRIQRQAGPV